METNIVKVVKIQLSILELQLVFDHLLLLFPQQAKFFFIVLL